VTRSATGPRRRPGLTAGLQQAVAVGVVANLLLLLHELNHPDVDELRLTRDGDLAPDGHTTVDGLLVLRIGAPLYTANARAAQARVLARVDAAHPHPHVLVLDATVTGRITTTVLVIMRELDTQLAERGVTMWVSSLPPRALEQARLTPSGRPSCGGGRLPGRGRLPTGRPAMSPGLRFRLNQHGPGSGLCHAHAKEQTR